MRFHAHSEHALYLHGKRLISQPFVKKKVIKVWNDLVWPAFITAWSSHNSCSDWDMYIHHIYTIIKWEFRKEKAQATHRSSHAYCMQKLDIFSLWQSSSLIGWLWLIAMNQGAEVYPSTSKQSHVYNSQTATMKAYEEKIVARPMHCKHPLPSCILNVHFCILLWQ